MVCAERMEPIDCRLVATADCPNDPVVRGRAEEYVELSKEDPAFRPVSVTNWRMTCRPGGWALLVLGFRKSGLSPPLLTQPTPSPRSSTPPPMDCCRAGTPEGERFATGCMVVPGC